MSIIYHHHDSFGMVFINAFEPSGTMRWAFNTETTTIADIEAGLQEIANVVDVSS